MAVDPLLVLVLALGVGLIVTIVLRHEPQRRPNPHTARPGADLHWERLPSRDRYRAAHPSLGRRDACYVCTSPLIEAAPIARDPRDTRRVHRCITCGIELYRSGHAPFDEHVARSARPAEKSPGAPKRAGGGIIRR